MMELQSSSSSVNEKNCMYSSTSKSLLLSPVDEKSCMNSSLSLVNDKNCIDSSTLQPSLLEDEKYCVGFIYITIIIIIISK